VNLGGNLAGVTLSSAAGVSRSTGILAIVVCGGSCIQSPSAYQDVGVKGGDIQYD